MFYRSTRIWVIMERSEPVPSVSANRWHQVFAVDWIWIYSINADAEIYNINVSWMHYILLYRSIKITNLFLLGIIITLWFYFKRVCTRLVVAIIHNGQIRAQLNILAPLNHTRRLYLWYLVWKPNTFNILFLTLILKLEHYPVWTACVV